MLFAAVHESAAGVRVAAGDVASSLQRTHFRKIPAKIFLLVFNVDVATTAIAAHTRR
jgi:hypothetical protein